MGRLQHPPTHAPLTPPLLFLPRSLQGQTLQSFMSELRDHAAQQANAESKEDQEASQGSNNDVFTPPRDPYAGGAQG